MTLHDYLKISEERCREYFTTADLKMIKPEELRRGTVEYFNRGGKRLRPAILMLCAGALGGKEAEIACIPAACAVELFHTFTLVHDDIIDNDPTRRGGKSVHVLVSDMFTNASKEKRDEYGRDVAILSGDMLHALSVKFCLDTADSNKFSPSTVIAVTKVLETECLAGVLEGEALDTREGLIKDSSKPFDTGSFEDTLNIMYKKTGYLFAFAAEAGAMLGLDTSDRTVKEVVALKEFALLCGVAFQIQDDILGITADEKTLGKPIGSDIREGKRTILLQKAYSLASAGECAEIEKVVGNKSASEDDILKIRNIFINTGAVDEARMLAKSYIEKALCLLDSVPSSHYCNILKEWAYFMSERNL